MKKYSIIALLFILNFGYANSQSLSTNLDSLVIESTLKCNHLIEVIDKIEVNNNYLIIENRDDNTITNHLLLSVDSMFVLITPLVKAKGFLQTGTVNVLNSDLEPSVVISIIESEISTVSRILTFDNEQNAQWIYVVADKNLKLESLPYTEFNNQSSELMGLNGGYQTVYYLPNIFGNEGRVSK